MSVYMYICIPTNVETKSLCLLSSISLSHKGTFNCIFPVLGIVPFTGCMKWSYASVYLPAAELNENNKKFNLTDALNLLKTFSFWRKTTQPNLQGKIFYSFFSPLWTEMGREWWLVIPINGHVVRISEDIRHNLFPDISPCISILISTLTHIKKHSDIL